MLIVVAALSLAGCSAQPSDGSSPSPSATTTPGNGSTTVEDGNGSVVEVPWANARVDDGDTRSSQEMPAISSLLPGCGILQTWGDLVACVEKNYAQWYKAGVNAHASTLGFSWADVESWAAARTVSGNVAESRVIFLSGKKTELTDDEANAAVAALTGGKVLKVVRLEAPAFMNTWRFGEGIQAFADYGSQVRVSLTPLVLDGQGQVVGLDGARQFAGVFVDCYNPHGLWQRVPEVPGGKLPSATAQPTTGPTEPAKPVQSTGGPSTTTEPPAPVAGKGQANPSSQDGYWGEADPAQAEAQAPAGPAVSADGGDSWAQVTPANPATQPGASNGEAQAPAATADSGTTAGGGDAADITDGGNAGGSGQGGDVDPD